MDLSRRKKEHFSRAFHQNIGNTEYNSVIHKAFRKYGYENFEYSVLEECLVTELDERENYWINYYDSKNNGYNCNDGGSEKHFCKLNPDVLENIRLDLVESNMTFEEIRLKHNVSIGFVSDFNSGKIWKQDCFEYPLRKNKKIRKYLCSACGAELYEKTTTGLCAKCYHIASRKATRPSRDELKSLIRTQTFVEIGKTYGVTDNTIKKWCDGYNLPRKKKDIKLYTEKEWETL